MLEPTAKSPSRPRIVVGAVVVLVLAAAFALLLPHGRRIAPTPPSPTSPLAPGEVPLPAAAPIDVLVWIESTPPGASIARVSDGFILGRTPETIQFRRSSKSVRVRFDAECFLPVTRELSVSSDGELSVVLKADPKCTSGPGAPKHPSLR